MPTKLDLKNKAISLRKKGYSYRDISNKINIPKSTLSDWLKNILLSNNQSNILLKRVSRGQMLGAQAVRDKRILVTKQIRENSIKEIGKISKKEILMLGAVLYWGEGSKQSSRNVSQPVEFVNSDPNMCKFFIKWIVESLGINMKDLIFRIYINESKKISANRYLNIWSNIINVSSENIKLFFTKDRYSKLKRIGKNNYKGQLRIVVKKSTNLNRRISGLVEGICLQSGIIN